MEKKHIIVVGLFIGAVACSNGDGEEPSMSASSAASAAACAGNATDSATETGYGRTGDAAIDHATNKTWFLASSGCEKKAAAACRSSGPSCVPGPARFTRNTTTVNSAEEEAMDPSTGGPVTHDYDPAGLNARPRVYTVRSTTPGNTGRAKRWKASVTRDVACEVACAPGDGGVEAGPVRSEVNGLFNADEGEVQ